MTDIELLTTYFFPDRFLAYAELLRAKADGGKLKLIGGFSSLLARTMIKDHLSEAFAFTVDFPPSPFQLRPSTAIFINGMSSSIAPPSLNPVRDCANF